MAGTRGRSHFLELSAFFLRLDPYIFAPSNSSLSSLFIIFTLSLVLILPADPRYLCLPAHLRPLLVFLMKDIALSCVPPVAPTLTNRLPLQFHLAGCIKH